MELLNTCLIRWLEKGLTIHNLTVPISEQEIRKLKINDMFFLTGTLVTMRDAAHKRALEFHANGKQMPFDLEGLAVFHCGPIVKKDTDEWKVVAAGPTTSSRMNMFEAELIKNFKVRVVVGKGGMDKKTVCAMKRYGAVYGALTGGTGVLAAKAIKRIKDVKWTNLGMPEAMWVLEVEDFGPLTVAIDSHGNSLFEDIQTKIQARKQSIYKRLGIE